MAFGLLFHRGISKHHLVEVDSGIELWFEAIRGKDTFVNWINFMCAYAPDFIVDEPPFEVFRQLAGRDEAWQQELAERCAELADIIGIILEHDSAPLLPQWSDGGLNGVVRPYSLSPSLSTIADSQLTFLY